MYNDVCVMCVCVCCRKLESKKRRLGQLEEQLQKLEVQATDKVCTYIHFCCLCISKLVNL